MMDKSKVLNEALRNIEQRAKMNRHVKDVEQLRTVLRSIAADAKIALQKAAE